MRWIVLITHVCMIILFESIKKKKEMGIVITFVSVTMQSKGHE